MRLRGATYVALATVLASFLAGCSLSSGSGEPGGWGTFFGDPNANGARSEASTAISVLVNNEFGDALEPSDRKAAEEAQERALKARGVGASVAWQNDQTGRSGQVRPGPVYFVNDTSCREFTHEMILNGRTLQARGAACESERGKWQVIG